MTSASRKDDAKYYGRPDFFATYGRLDRSIEGLDGAAEWPALRAMLPNVAGLRVIDLGCGFGWFCRWAREQKAAQVVRIDLSERMLKRARAANIDGAIRYERADLERLELPAASFDLAYSSLALHWSKTSAERLRSYTKRFFPADAWCSRSSTRSTWRRISPAGLPGPTEAEPGRLTTILPRGRGPLIGLSKAL